MDYMATLSWRVTLDCRVTFDYRVTLSCRVVFGFRVALDGCRLALYYSKILDYRDPVVIGLHWTAGLP